MIAYVHMASIDFPLSCLSAQSSSDTSEDGFPFSEVVGSNPTAENKVINLQPTETCPFGDQICKLLNEGAFRNLHSSKTKYSFKLVPLFSSSNARWIQEKITSIRKTFSLRTPYGSHQPSIIKCVFSFGLILTFSSLAISLLITVFLRILFRFYFFIFKSILSIFLDLDDLYHHLPKECMIFIDHFKFYINETDHHIFYARSFKGRDPWIEEIDITTKSLIDRPIPSTLKRSIAPTSEVIAESINWNDIKDGLESHHIEENTKDHLLGLSFSYAMICGKHIPLLNIHKKNLHQVVKTIISLSKQDGLDENGETSSDLLDDLVSNPNDTFVAIVDDEVGFNQIEDINDDVSTMEIQYSGSEAGQKWLDVGTKIGLRLLKSEKIKKAMSQKAAEENYLPENDLILDTVVGDNNPGTPERFKPFHPMWSPGLGDHDSIISNFSANECNDDDSVSSLGSGRFTEKSKQIVYDWSPLKVRSRRQSNLNSSTTSSPTSSVKKRNLNLSIDAVSPLVGGSSISSSIQWKPKAFDANKYLPPSIAINYTVESSKPELDTKEVPSSPKKKSKKSRPVLKIKQRKKRAPLLPGVKMLIQISKSPAQKDYQLVTVRSCSRISLDPSSDCGNEEDQTDSLSICAYIDKSFLRNGCFAMISFRIPDSQRQFPRHSKFPISSPVLTSYGVGVLVGWRSKDDCHIVRSLWKKRGLGSGHGYFNRDALLGVVEAGVGFKVDTTLGPGKVMGYTDGQSLQNLKYVVQVKRNGVNLSELKILERCEILSCTSAKFIPVVEQIREAAKYQIQIEIYKEEKLQSLLEDEMMIIDKTWKVFSEGFEIFLSSFITAAEEDSNFDSEISNFLSSFIAFLEDFDVGSKSRKVKFQEAKLSDDRTMPTIHIERTSSEIMNGTRLWLFNDLFGASKHGCNSISEPKSHVSNEAIFEKSYNKMYGFLRLMMRTINITKAKCAQKPNLKMGLTIVHEFLLFVYNVIKVQQVNMTKTSINEWTRTLKVVEEVFGPTNERLQKIGSGIIQRIEEHGKIAKLRSLKFADLLVSDDKLVESLETGDISEIILRVEDAAIAANILSKDLRNQYHDLGIQLYNAFFPNINRNPEAAYRNGKKLTFLAKTLKVLATPSRSLLVLLTNDDILGILERILVRVFERDEVAPQIVNIYCWNFRTLRHLRLLSNMSLVGILWSPVLDAADEEFSWATSVSPPQTQEYIAPLAKLFSLGVARFHEIQRADSNVSLDWIDFLVEDDAVKIIQELDSALRVFLQHLSDDVKEMMSILPYVSSIDDDILSMIDHIDIEQELKEIGEALADKQSFATYVQQKGESAVNAIIEYIPKVSIPIERREIGEGWVITCRGRNGKDLTLSNISIQKDNLECSVFGSPILAPDEVGKNSYSKQSLSSVIKESTLQSDDEGNVEVSILDHIAELIRNAQHYGCWDLDRNATIDVRKPASISSSSLNGLPLSRTLTLAIDLWDHLLLTDEDLLQLAIRDISNEIRKVDTSPDCMNDEFAELWKADAKRVQEMHRDFCRTSMTFENIALVRSLSCDITDRRFDPRGDPTILYLHMSQLTCCLDDFIYRIEPETRKTIFDPVLEGVGILSVKNFSLKMRVELRKERIKKLEKDVIVPVLQLSELDIGLEYVQFSFKETGLDWLLNKIIGNFGSVITKIVRDNLKAQITKSIITTLDTLNNSLQIHPDLFLKVLGISLDDLEDNVAWV